MNNLENKVDSKVSDKDKSVVRKEFYADSINQAPVSSSYEGIELLQEYNFFGPTSIKYWM